MTKKIFFFALIILLILVGFLIYYLTKRKPSPPSAKPFQIIKISKKQVYFPTLSQDETNILYYFEPEAVFYQLSLETGQEKTTSPLLSFIKKVIWAKGPHKAILKVENLQAAKTESFFYTPERPHGELVTWFYDFETEQKTFLPQNIQGVAWTADGQKIVYHYLDKTAGINNLSLADPDGKNWKKIIDLKDETVFLNILEAGEVVYTASETADSFNAIKTDGLSKRAIKLPILVNINKIVWPSDGKSLLAAVRETGNSDTFYKINIETGQKEAIKYQSEIEVDAKNLILTKDEKTLYFTSDDYLYSLGLP